MANCGVNIRTHTCLGSKGTHLLPIGELGRGVGGAREGGGGGSIIQYVYRVPRSVIN